MIKTKVPGTKIAKKSLLTLDRKVVVGMLPPLLNINFISLRNHCTKYGEIVNPEMRVGVWSIFRYGNPEQSSGDFLFCLQRTIKVATHETGHMFSMQHCTRYACNMCGSNHLRESDRRPLALCPECLAKTCWVTKTDPVERYKKLLEFFKEHGLTVQTEFCKQSLKALE